MKEKLLQALKSRTVRTIVVMFVVGGVQSIHQFIPADYMVVVDAVLSLLAIYFRLNPKQ